MSGNSRILAQGLQGIESASQLHLTVQLVNAAVAATTQHDAFIELLTAVVFGKTIAAVQLSGYQMVKGQGALTSAQLTRSLLQRHCKSGCNNSEIKPVQPV